MAQGGRHSEAHVQEMIGLGDRLIESSKEIQALGAFDSDDRCTAMDLLGFKKQLVFATHSVALPFHPSAKTSSELRYGAVRAHNRHMSDFCAGDDRLMGVGIVPLDMAGRSPGHVELEGFWDRLAESGTPFVLHVGGSPLQSLKAWLTALSPVMFPRHWRTGG